MLSRATLEDPRSQIKKLSKVKQLNLFWPYYKKVIMNDTDYDQLHCHLCNAAGTEECGEDSKCVCKAFYQGAFCQNCRFGDEFILAPNGTCIPCPCNGRSLQECFQNGLCSTHSTVSMREATAASAIFMATLSAIVLVGAYLLYRIVKRTRHLRAVAQRNYLNEEYPDMERIGVEADEEGNRIWKDEERLVNGRTGNHILLTPISDVSTPATSLFHIRSPSIADTAFRGRKSISAFFSNFHKRKPDANRSPSNNAASTPALLSVEDTVANASHSGFDDSDYPKGGLKISSSCFEYYFLSVQNNADDDDDPWESGT